MGSEIQVLAWYNAIFFVPMTLSALLLLLSSIRIGGHHGARGAAGHGHGNGTGMRAHTHPGGAAARHHLAGAPRAATASARVAAARLARAAAQDSSPAPIDLGPHDASWRLFLGAVFGVGRAPLIVVVEMFFLSFGLIGLLANGAWIGAGRPLVATLLPSLAAATVGGAFLARLFAAALSRILPGDGETAALSRDGLFGLTGTVAYPVSDSGGRIHVYDEFGTLHDEACRAQSGSPLIAKGRRARIVDITTDGKLIVEEAV